MHRLLQVHAFAVLLFAAALPSLAFAAAVSAPVGGAFVPLPEGEIICGETSGGWLPDPSGTKVRPPIDATQIGKASSIKVASSAAACAGSKDSISLIPSGPVPIVDRRTVEVWIDEGHVDLRGSHLEGSRLEWESKDEHGSDVCESPSQGSNQQSCSYSVSRKLSSDPADIRLKLLPAGSTSKCDVYDEMGHLVAPDAITITPARIVVSGALTVDKHVDLSSGDARMSLTHPRAVISADCDVGRCELSDGEIRLRSIGGLARTLSLRLRLAPRVYARSGDSFVQAVTIPVDVTYCPVSIESPAVLRDTDDVRVVARIDSKCLPEDDTFHWLINGSSVPVLATESQGKFVYVLLGLGRVSSERVTVAAARGSNEASVIGLASVATTPPPLLRVGLRLTGYGGIDYIPTNRNVVVTATAPNLKGKIVTLPVEGAYEVQLREGRTEIRGTADGGYVVLKFALRDDSLPGHLAQADLAHFTGNVQRAIRQVNVPAPIGDPLSKLPVAEVLCNDANGRGQPVVPGVPLHIPFDQRNGCRLVIHSNRIPIEDGDQRLDIEINVISVGGIARPQGHFAQRLSLSHGAEPRIIWIKGVEAQFDQITVILTHVTEDSQYIRSGTGRVEIPSGQWTIVAENTRWRFYATVSIPVQLFRFSNDPNGSGTGPLSLNLGVLSRFTWVTRDGSEGILGLEGGVMGMGLSADNTRQLNIVAGLGLGVPLGNKGQASQASINIHAWAAYRLGNEYAPLLDANGAPQGTQTIALRHWSFVFGPSVTFGNIGFDI